MTLTSRAAALMAAVLAGLFGASSSALAQARPVNVFAAASLQNALKDAGRAYTAETGQPVQFSFAASSTLARQIEQGAKADLYVSADVDWMSYLAERKLITPETRRDLLTNRLALIAPKDSGVRLKIARGFPLAKALGPGRLAMADPDSVPAGKYGKAALTALGVWDQVKDRVARAENVRAALTFVARGEAPLGITYDTDAKVEPQVRIVDLFPESTHPRIIYPASVTSGATQPQAAARFLGWLQGSKAGAIFAQYGFKTLARPR